MDEWTQPVAIRRDGDGDGPEEEPDVLRHTGHHGHRVPASRRSSAGRPGPGQFTGYLTPS